MPISIDDLFGALPADFASRDLLEAMYRKNLWLTKPMLESLSIDDLPAYLGEVDDVWSTMRRIRPDQTSEQRLAEAMRGLQFHSMEFLKRQIEFSKTGEYKAVDYDTVFKEVYNNAAVMQQYLDGLLLTYVAWPNHYRLLNWYRDAYLAKATPGECLEIGPGHGWLAMWQLRSHPANNFVGLDISPHSVAYTRGCLGTAGFAPERWKVLQADAQKGIADHGKPFDRVVIAEVIEHLAHPEVIVEAALRHSHPGTLFFITTVVNLEAVDHIFLFRKLEEVRDFCEKTCGLKILDQLDLPLKLNLKDMRDEAFEVAVVCRPA
jgi:2-polyprenyl-3-methyl-5-hydroxy-6-metoxy-1,4-benzoquinol methylase